MPGGWQNWGCAGVGGKDLSLILNAPVPQKYDPVIIKVKHGLVSQACFWPRSLQCCYSGTNDNKMIVGTNPSKVGPQNMFPATK